MLKKIFALILAAAILGSTQACTMPNNIFADETFSNNDDNTAVSETEIYDFAFSLDDQSFELPMNYAAMSARGWKFTEAAETQKTEETVDDETAVIKHYDSSSVLEPDEYSDYVTLKNKDLTISAKFHNDGSKAKSIADCKVVGVRVDAEDGALPAIKMNDDDISVGNKYDIVLNLCGKPSYIENRLNTTDEVVSINDITLADTDEDTYSVLYYKLTDHSFISFTIGKYKDVSNSIVCVTIENDYEKEKPYDYSKEKKYKPDNVALYKGPNLLGKQFSDFAFKFEGNLYTLPLPVRTLMDNGWEFVRGYGERIPMGTTVDGLIMRKGNLAVSMKVHNYDLKYAHTAINCYAVSLEACLTGPNVSILMSKGITLGSTEQKLVEAFGKDYVKKHPLADEEGNPLPSESDTYEIPNMPGYTIEKTVDDEYTVYSYIMPDDVPSVTLPVSITDIGDTGVDLLGKNRKHIDVYVSNETHLIYKFYLQNCPEYVVDEQKILEEQLEEARKKEKEEREKQNNG